MKRQFKLLIIMGVSLVVIGVGIGISVFNSYAANESAERFTDIESHWAIRYINDLSEKGVISGYEDGTFRPDQKITNVDFLSMTLKAMGQEIEESSHIEGNGYDSIYKKAVQLNLIDDKDPNDLTAIYPNEYMTREQAARVIYKALGFLEDFQYNQGLNDPDVSENDVLLNKKFEDLFEVNPYYKRGVKGALISGIMSGYTDKNFNPKANLTRAQASVLIDKLIDSDVRGSKNVLGQERVNYYDDVTGQYETLYLDEANRDLAYLLRAIQSNHYEEKPYISLDFNNVNDRVIEAKYYQSDSDFNRSEVPVLILKLYLDKGQAPYEDKKIEINIPQTGDTILDINQTGSVNFILNYLFGCINCYVTQDYAIEGQDYPDMINEYYQEVAHKTVDENTIEGVSFSTKWRDLEIARYVDHVSIFASKMNYKDGEIVPFDENTDHQVSCSDDFETIEFPDDSHVTDVCNESVNTILDSIVNEKRSDILVLDVRTPEEYSEGSIEGAVNIPVDELDAHLDEVNQYDYVLVYCQSGGRSAKAAKLLSEQNQDMKIFNFSEGYPAYERIEEVSE